MESDHEFAGVLDRRDIHQLIAEAKISPGLSDDVKQAMVRYITRREAGEIERTGASIWRHVARACGGTLEDFLAISRQVPEHCGPRIIPNPEWVAAVAERLR